MGLNPLPELELFPTKQQRRKAFRRVSRKMIGTRPFFMAAVSAAGLSLALTLVLRAAGSQLGLPISQTTLNLILAFPVAIPCAFFGYWLLRRHYPKLLRQELLDCGVPVCVHCGYLLKGSPGPTCPECGKAFDERVRKIKNDSAPSDED